ncbi:MAG: sulfite dehydrogenase [Gemmatimonadaceae bacterium]
MSKLSDSRISRRALLAGAGTAVAGTIIAGTASLGSAQSSGAATLPQATPAPVVPLDPTAAPGAPTSAMSARSPFVTMARNPVGAIAGSSQSPIHLFSGSITPIDLQFERHHAGVPTIDPARHQLLIHGKVERPLAFTLDDLQRFPSVTRIHFLECSGNGRGAYRTPKAELSPQQVDGLLSNAEWTGVPLKFLLNEVGVGAGATWVLAEGSDAARLSRSVPLDKLMDDALVAYAQNGEPLRPSGGFPMRLLLPGWEGNANVKWLRRLELIDQPNMSRDETSKYTDPLPNDTARQFSFVLDAKSIITSPAFPGAIPGKGWIRVNGVAWSGRGRIAAVDVSTDGGSSWTSATLQDAVLPKSLTRFELMWEWNGSPARLMSRAVDETGYVQPTYEEFKAARGPGTDYHYNYIRTWVVAPDGHVTYGVPA